MKTAKYKITLLAAACAALCGCGGAKNGSPYAETGYAMGAVVKNTIYADEGAGEAVSENIMDGLSSLEKEYLSWRVPGSLTAKINAKAGSGEKVALDDASSRYFKEMLSLAEKSGGAFDPSIGGVSELWGFYGSEPAVPDPTRLKDALSACGYKHIRYEDASGKNPAIISTDAGVKLDLGAVGKGIGCDAARNMLESEKEKISGALVSIGGSLLAYGGKPDKSPWNIAITDPRGEGGGYLGTLALADTPCFISTSGDYEKYFMEGGICYHHVIDPKTGYPADSGIISATVVCENGLLSDGLSTACFVLGIKDSMPLLREYGAEAVFVSSDMKVAVTGGLKDKFTLEASGYEIDRHDYM